MNKKIIWILVIIIMVVFCYNKSTFTRNKNLSEAEFQEIKNAGMVKGYLWTSTIGIKEYCSSTGYIPQAFITGLENRLTKTIAHSDEIINKYNLQNKLKEKETQSYNQNMKTIENAFENYKIKYGSDKTKLDFCKQIDENKSSLIDDKVNLLIQSMPSGYMD